MFYQIWLSDSGGEAVWESHLCCFGLAVSSFERRAAPCAGTGSRSWGPWSAIPPELGKELSYSSSLTNASGSTAQAEQIQCVMKTLVLPGSHTACFPFPVLWRILSSVSVDGHVKLQHFGHWPEWCELHVQSCDSTWGMKLSSYYEARELSDFFSVVRFYCFYSCSSVVPILSAEAVRMSSTTELELFWVLCVFQCENSAFEQWITRTRGMSVYIDIVLSTR